MKISKKISTSSLALALSLGGLATGCAKHSDPAPAAEEKGGEHSCKGGEHKCKGEEHKCKGEESKCKGEEHKCKGGEHKCNGEKKEGGEAGCGADSCSGK